VPKNDYSSRQGAKNATAFIKGLHETGNDPDHPVLLEDVAKMEQAAQLPVGQPQESVERTSPTTSTIRITI